MQRFRIWFWRAFPIFRPLVLFISHINILWKSIKLFAIRLQSQEPV
jgi:hypothetical protein